MVSSNIASLPGYLNSEVKLPCAQLIKTYAMKRYGGVGFIGPRFVDLGTSRR
jgi:hypothetical protein